jgi:hypothetical protein
VTVPLTTEQFVELLRRGCPEAAPLIDEHLLGFDGEILLHLLVADVRRLALAFFEARDIRALDRCLDVVAAGLRDGDEYVENAVAVSFVEDAAWWDEAMSPFIAAWPGALRAEAERQRAASGDST